MWIETKCGSWLNTAFLCEIYIEFNQGNYVIMGIDKNNEKHEINSFQNELQAKEELKYHLELNTAE